MARISFDAALWQRFVDAYGALIASATNDNPAPASTPVPQPVEVTSGVPKMAWGAKVSATFRARVAWIAATLALDVNWIMACIAWESGESFSPSKKNMAGSGATGLIQFMPSTAADLGTTTAALAKMTAEDQLNYVYKYFRLMIKQHGPIKSIEDCYMAILWPAAVGKPITFQLFKSQVQYRQNSGLDTNKDGVITKYEAASHVREKLAKGMALAA
jgi:hypothetical protein